MINIYVRGDPNIYLVAAGQDNDESKYMMARSLVCSLLPKLKDRANNTWVQVAESRQHTINFPGGNHFLQNRERRTRKEAENF